MADRYEVGELLGRGGFAAVYAGFDPVIKRDVAIKVLHSYLLGDEKADKREAMLIRFRQEASSAASIGHPNVVNIFDMGVIGDDEQPFIVMERLDGHDLEAELGRSGPIPAARLLPLFATALEAIGAAHKKGVVHRDLKPSNLFLVNPDTEEEDIRVVDFGIARVEQAEGVTATGQVVGTARYLAPEYIIRSLVSPALDVYQMGLILVELLSGAPVVEGEGVLNCVHMHTNRDLRVPEALLTSPLGPLVTRALAFEPEERFADGREFARALRAIDPLSIPPVPATSPRFRVDDVSGNLHSATIPKDVSTGALAVRDARSDEASAPVAEGSRVLVGAGATPLDAMGPQQWRALERPSGPEAVESQVLPARRGPRVALVLALVALVGVFLLVTEVGLSNVVIEFHVAPRDGCVDWNQPQRRLVRSLRHD